MQGRRICWFVLYQCFDSVVSVTPRWDLEGLGGLVWGYSGSGLFLHREPFESLTSVLSGHGGGGGGAPTDAPEVDLLSAQPDEQAAPTWR